MWKTFPNKSVIPGRNSSLLPQNSPFGSANRWIYGSLSLAQICPATAPQTSYTPETLGDIAYNNREGT